jgi:hypothetical protein
MSMAADAIAGTQMAGAGPAGIAAALHGGAGSAGEDLMAGWAGIIPAPASMSPPNLIIGHPRRVGEPTAPTATAKGYRGSACVGGWPRLDPRQTQGHRP